VSGEHHGHTASGLPIATSSQTAFDKAAADLRVLLDPLVGRGPKCSIATEGSTRLTRSETKKGGRVAKILGFS